mmetsp:Transcript_17624/g.61638  ORF Transcript_17624/g.61638 Transcript_17624/m.61638 type:complete len:244 (-) Transcript_17624:1656-2387(-)
MVEPCGCTAAPRLQAWAQQVAGPAVSSLERAAWWRRCLLAVAIGASSARMSSSRKSPRWPCLAAGGALWHVQRTWRWPGRRSSTAPPLLRPGRTRDRAWSLHVRSMGRRRTSGEPSRAGRRLAMLVASLPGMASFYLVRGSTESAVSAYSVRSEGLLCRHAHAARVRATASASRDASTSSAAAGWTTWAASARMRTSSQALGSSSSGIARPRASMGSSARPCGGPRLRSVGRCASSPRTSSSP